MIRPAPHSNTHPGFDGRIGVAREDITSPVGIYARNWGAALQDAAEGVHRPLTATAITIQSDVQEPPLVLVSLDLGWWRSYRDERVVRDFLLEALNLGAERLMLSFTHTHSGPVLCREDADKPGGALIAPYLDFLRNKALSAISNALSSAVPAALEWSYGKCSLAQNRDLRDPDQDRFLSGFNPQGVPDDTLLVGRVTAADGRMLATLVNYACHPTTLAWQNRLLSPDFVGAMRELVEANTDGAHCLYLQGASGELAPREQYTADTSIADANGRQLGFAVLSTLTGMLPAGAMLTYRGAVESGAPLALWERERRDGANSLTAVRVEVELPLQPLPTLTELNAQIAASDDRVQIERLDRKRRIREGVGDGGTTSMPVWIWQVGEALFVGHPNEAYSQLQTELRRRFPGRPIAAMNVVNGHFGYLPPAHLYGEDLYPVWQTPFGPGSLETLIEACADSIESLITSSILISTDGAADRTDDTR